MNVPQQMTDTIQKALRFRWSFVIIPLIVFVISVIMAAVFIPLLGDTVLLRFSDNGSAREISKAGLLTLLLAPNVLFTLISLALVRLLMAGSKNWDTETSFITRVVPLLGNMPGLVQAVVVAAVLQICLYNIYNVSIGPFWVYAVIIMAAGAVFLGVQLNSLLKASKQLKENSIQENDTNV